MAAPVIEARGIVKRYGDVTALGGVDLTVEEGTVLGLLGPNGAGKTTLVRVLTTLLLPDEGTATVAGFDVRTQPQQVRGSVGLAGQFAAVDPLLTGRENIELVGRLYGLPAAEARRRAVRLLERLSLSDDADRLVRGYSGGMRRRLDLGASLVGEPRILVLDEPTTGLDPRTRIELWEIVESLVAEGTTVLLTTQYLEEADELASRVGIIDRGRLAAQGAPADLKRAVGTDVVEADIHGDIEQAAAAVRALAAIEEVVVAGHVLTIRTANGSAALSPVALALAASGAEVRSLTLRTPTLDDVFLQLTGGHLQAGAEAA